MAVAAGTNKLNGGYSQSISLPFVQTLDATPTDIVLFAMPIGATVHLDLMLIARAADGTSKVFRTTRSGKNVGGTITLVGASLPSADIEADAGAALWTATIAASGQNIITTVTGAAATTINLGRARGVLPGDVLNT